MTKQTVYIAAPYTLGDVAVNVRRAIQAADELIEAGFIPYVPHLTHFWHIVSPKLWDFWLELDLCFLLKCDCVLRLNGESKGADREVEIANKAQIPVYHSVSEIVPARDKHRKEHGKDKEGK